MMPAFRDISVKHNITAILRPPQRHSLSPPLTTSAIGTRVFALLFVSKLKGEAAKKGALAASVSPHGEMSLGFSRLSIRF